MTSIVSATEIPTTTTLIETSSTNSTGIVATGEVSILFVTSIFTSDLAASIDGSSTLSPASISSPSDTPNQSQTGNTTSASNTARATKQPVSSNIAIAGIAVAGAVALLILICGMWIFSRRRAHKRNEEGSATDERTRKSELATDTEIKEMGSGIPKKIELGVCGHEVKELKGLEATTEIAAGQARLIYDSRRFDGVDGVAALVVRFVLL
ncbi:hypothetical protein MMC17_000440 [Xylographa soralifera]|nr:hypothetical protein [Xylographa soralifera]